MNLFVPLGISNKIQTQFSSLMIVVLIGLTGCGGGSSDSSVNAPPDIGSYQEFGAPQFVEVVDFDGDVMEPFFSREGNYLFFNDNAVGDNGSDKNLHFATYLSDTSFQYAGELTSVNTTGVDGAPSMDNQNNFYFVSTINYAPPTNYAILYRGIWDGTNVSQLEALSSLAIETPGWVNFDLEISPDGQTLYFNDGDFRGGNNFPDAADIAIATLQNGQFTRLSNSVTLTAAINTDELEYAPSVSADGLEMFFTRLMLSDLTTEIYRSTRNSIGEPFANTQKVAAISGFVEGTTFSPDERSLYFHRLNQTSGRFELYRVTRL